MQRAEPHAVEELIPTRGSLLSRLRDWNDQESWKAFFDTYWRLIYNAAIKAGLRDAEAQDVVQETIIAVSKKMPGFRYDPKRGSFKGWLLRLTEWRIIDQFRKRRSAELSEGECARPADTRTDTPFMERLPDPAGVELEALWDAEWDQHLYEAAVRKVKGSVAPKDYQIFSLYVLKKWPAARVAEAMHVSRGNVYFAKHRVGRLVKAEVLRLKKGLV